MVLYFTFTVYTMDITDTERILQDASCCFDQEYVRELVTDKNDSDSIEGKVL